jgi:hypothetical protein
VEREGRGEGWEGIEWREREGSGGEGRGGRGGKGEGKGWTPLGPGPQNFWARTATGL